MTLTPVDVTPADTLMSAPLRLPPLRTEGRLDRLKARLIETCVDAAVISDLSNIRWLTGFTGSNGTLVVSLINDDAILITDSRYAEQAPSELDAAGCSKDIKVVVAQSPAVLAAEHLGAVDRLGLEVTVAWGEQRLWDEVIEAELVPLTEIVEEMRAVKDASELARIRAAARIADQALEEVQCQLRPGETELNIQRTLDDIMRSLGATGPAYDTIVASGPNSALPHARPTRRRLQAGDLVVIDVGAEVDGYRSDMTRTFVLGLPDMETAAMIEAVTRSQAEGVSAVSPGVGAAEIDRVCRGVIEEADMGDYFIHSTGHGVGLNIHELPRVNQKSIATLQPGNVLTVEPGVYVPDVGGVRMEDLVVVTENGCRLITGHPKDTVI